VRNRFGAALPIDGNWHYLFTVDEQSLRYQPLLLLLCGAAAIGLLAYLRLGSAGRDARINPRAGLLASSSIAGR
jgi:hypothetical protein